jgi:rhamnulokinase
MASDTHSNNSFIEPDHASFFQPGDIPTRIKAFCKQSHQSIPSSDGELSCCIFESLALKYRWVLDIVEEIKGQKSDVLHIVGGGSNNRLLCQMAANATGKLVIAGPDEATTAGNIMMQAIAEGTISSIQEGKQVVRDSFNLRTYEPQDTDLWDEKYAGFTNLKETADTII